ncbi:HNH endonuclease [Pantoea sp. Cy-640]|uniref:HNH endonuclease n=1 Tax=Pantoea sp. Cy-640 TaxID=2608353 RepID=UPI001419444D|nr:HNH endonuclease [Pantoea sp. Cy-640]NIG16790.1 HNH endonuclease [Pantoea sp. Cy-640]
MLDEVNYSEKALLKIKEKLKSNGFCGSYWSDDDIDFIRKEIKYHYIKAQAYTCVYCKQVIKSTNGRVWDIEHIISRELACEFMFEPKNLCAACPECNHRKGAHRVTQSKARRRLPSKSDDYSIVHPHFDNYDEHIEAIKPGEFYISKTQKGEKTISLCGLNRFYEFAGYDEAVTSNNQILQYANMLSNIKDESQKKICLRNIATLAIRQLLVNSDDK